MRQSVPYNRLQTSNTDFQPVDRSMHAANPG